MFEMLEKHLEEEPPTVHLVMATNHSPHNLNLKKIGYDAAATLAEIKKLPNVPDPDMLAVTLGNYWYMDKVISSFIRSVNQNYPGSLFVFTGSSSYPPNSHSSIFEAQCVPLVLFGDGIYKKILPNDVVGSHISIVPTIVELIAPKDFTYYSIAPSLFDSNGVGFNREVFITESVAGKIDFDVIEILPQVPSADLDNLNLAVERDRAKDFISAIRTVAWWILNEGLDF